jgi:uncharacterized protein (DUF1330 family)
MPAYCIFENIDITEPARLEDYKQRVGPVVQRFGGRYVVLGGQVAPKEGDWKPGFLVMIEFPSLAQAEQWYHSADYEPLRRLRLSAGHFNAVFVEGL